MATAGHVDHGKTSLMRVLTGTDTDRLPEEKRRGISLELGFAALPDSSLSFIDVPGHRRLVHTMIAGVGGVDAILLVVAADDGVMPQTREHLHVCSLLGVRRLLVTLTKCDLVDAETLDLARADVEGVLDELGFTPDAILPTSSETGAGIPELDRALRDLATSVPERAGAGRLWLPIDRVFSVKGAGTVITGTLTRGRLSVGDDVYVAGVGGTRPSSCRALEVHGSAVTTVSAPARVAVNLAKLDRSDVERGDVVSLDPDLPRPRFADVTLTSLPGTDKLLRDGSPVVFHAGARRTGARIRSLGEGLARLTLDEPIPLEGGLGYVLRGFAESRARGGVLGGGRVLDASAPPLPRARSRARDEHTSALRDLAEGKLDRAMAAFAKAWAPRPVVAVDVERRLGLSAGDVERAVPRKSSVLVALPGGGSWTTREAIDRVGTELLRRVERHHETHPHEPGISAETLRSALADRSSRIVADLALESATRAQRVVAEQGVVALPAFALQNRATSTEVASRALEAVESAGLEGATEADVVATTGETSEVVRGALGRLGTQGDARRLGGMWFAERCLEDLRRRVREHLATESAMSVPTFKEIAGVSRKQAIPLLEQLDREGTTERRGDLRVLGRR